MTYRCSSGLVVQCALIFLASSSMFSFGALATEIATSTSFSSSNTRNTLECDIDEVPVKVEVYPDVWEETRWEIKDINTGTIVKNRDRYDWQPPFTRYEDTYCIEKISCYGFTIFDTAGNGICCGGFYKLYYDNILIKEGGEFGSEESSPLFGDNCPTSEPSLSQEPSKSPTPSKMPSTSPSPSSECDIDKVPVKVEVRTDIYFDETRWEIKDINTDTIVKTKNDYDEPFRLYEDDTYCIEKLTCYGFTIFDTAKNGICCSAGRGYYKLYYDKILIKEGGEFESEESSPLFGDNCPTSKPSLSQEPSKSLTPSKMPSTSPSSSPSVSKNPSLEPSTSFEPSTSSEPTISISQNPSFSPTLTPKPTSPPTKKPPAEFSKDEYGRRLFPPQVLRPNDRSFSLQPIPDCNVTKSEGRIGCIGFPSSVAPKSDWTEKKLYQTNPYCTVNEHGRDKKCHLNKLESRSMSPIDLLQASSGFDERNVVALEGEDPKEGDNRATGDIATGDFNNDGHIDVVLGNWNNSRNQILYNKGNGKFHDPVDIPGGSYNTGFIDVVDLDSDGFDDIVSVSIPRSGGLSHILWNDGNGSFTEMELPGNPYKSAANVAFWDFDGNGELDMVISRWSQPNVLVYNNGERNFDPNMVDLPGDSSMSFGVAVGDINNDGNIDIVISNADGEEPNELLINNGNGSFDVRNLPGDDISISIGLADFDEDGFLDIVIANGFGEREENQILWNNGDSTFNSKELPGGSHISVRVNIADVDGDGKLDVIFVNEEDPHYILRYTSKRTFNEVELPHVGSSSQGSVIADIDNNGMLDILVAITTADPNQVLKNYVDGRSDSLFAEELVYAEFTSDNIEWIDDPSLYVQDDTLAIVIAPSYSRDGDDSVDIVMGNNGGNFVWISHKDDDSRLYPNDFGEDHLSADNILKKTTCVVSLYTSRTYYIFVGNENRPNQMFEWRYHFDPYEDGKNGWWGEVDDFSDSDMKTLSAASGDINNDGFIDLVIGNNGSPNQVLFGDGDGNFRALNLPGSEELETKSIAIADINGDNLLDVVVGNGLNEAQRNYLLTNNGNETFSSEELPGGESKTHSIAVGNLINEDVLDIVVGNHNEKNYILQKNGTEFQVKELPGGTLRTNALALADLDGDGDLDIVIANGYTEIDNSTSRIISSFPQKNQILLNVGGGNFEESSFPGSLSDSRAVAIYDVNEDGTLDILFGNYGQTNTIFLGSTCKSGAQLHSQSWCFKCPQFMGRNLFMEQSIAKCEECAPDRMQAFEGEICAEFSCPTSQRPLGSNSCTQCPTGTFYDGGFIRRDWLSQYKDSPCVDCPKGSFADDTFLAVNKCSPCPIETSQNKTGSSKCDDCKPGFFQSQRGQAVCNTCTVGSFCDPTDSTCTMPCPCHPGTYNGKEGSNKKSDCISCPIGTFSTETGANSSSTCIECLPGSYSDREGQTQCTRCIEGSYQSNKGSNECVPCSAGTYSDAEGQAKCSQCPYRLSSIDNSTLCEFCDEGFYLKDSSVDPSEIFMSPSKFCEYCPPNAECPFNTTLQTLVLKPNHWRETPDTSKIYPCNNKACKGSSALQKKSESPGTYCIDGHTGPLCQVCTDDNEYFAPDDVCKECPSFVRLAIPICVILSFVGIFFISRFAARRFEGYGKFVAKASSKVSVMGLQAKLKILITFYQIVKTLNDVYGVEIDTNVKGWLSFVDYFDFGFYEIAGLPRDCIGSMKTRLILGATWPFTAICACFICIIIYAFFVAKRSNNELDIMKFLWMRLLYISILILFLTLPSIAGSIFEARKCRPFDSSDDTKEAASYLIADWSIRCDQGEEYNQLQDIFWIMFVLWLVAIPASAFALLMKIRHSVESQQITPLAESCSFLWRDYRKEFVYWEIMSLVHRLFLTGLIMLVDTQEGVDKSLRLIIAIFFCTVYFGMLLYASPYLRKEDQDLALISNLLLIACFILGIPIHMCGESAETCQDLFGYHLNSYRVSVLAVGLICSMLVVTIIFLVLVGIYQEVDATIKLNTTNEMPIMDLPPECQCHLFLSHVWSSGQDKTHSLVQKLRLYIPGIKIWLDVENLTNMESLESSVGESAVFILMYTDGYFRSKNCRREIYAAVKSCRPTIVLYEGDDSTLETMKQKCLTYCTDGDTISCEDVFDFLSKEDTLLWLGASSRYFATASIKELSLRILQKLPYYKRNPEDLSKGVKVENELGPIDIQKDCVLLYSAENSNAEELATEVKQAATNSDDIDVEDFQNYMENTDFDREPFFLLYLDDQVFSDSDHILEGQVKIAIDKGLTIILVHETDMERGGVPFDEFFRQTPQHLLVAPYNLFSDIAISLYTFDKYREISHRLILSKMRDTRSELTRKGLLRRTVLKSFRKGKQDDSDL